MEKIEVIIGDIFNEEHQKAMISLLDDYMQDPMGGVGPISDELAYRVVEGLKLQTNYLFFLAISNGEYAGLANCYINFSTFKAKQYINIHDFTVSSLFRKKGIGKKLMEAVVAYAETKGFSKVNLEVRHDNSAAQALYKSTGFADGNPPMYFWERYF